MPNDLVYSRGDALNVQRDRIRISFALHEKRRKLLDSIATLAGYKVELAHGLPDGCRPDVLRINPQERGLFIGEAKNCEPPSNLSTRVRLYAYFRWLLIHTVDGGGGILAICFGNVRDTIGWTYNFNTMANEAGVPFNSIHTTKVGPGLLIIWGYIQH